MITESDKRNKIDRDKQIELMDDTMRIEAEHNWKYKLLQDRGYWGVERTCESCRKNQYFEFDDDMWLGDIVKELCT